MLTIGHRGASGCAPENSLVAFEKAIEMNVAMIEFDVRTCATGEVVVIHDDRVDRTTSGSGYVKQMTLKELKQLSLIEKIHTIPCLNERSQSEQLNSIAKKIENSKNKEIPTLEETLDFINRRVTVNIELKGKSGIGESVARIIKYYVQHKGWLYEDFLVSSFDHHEIKMIKTIIPELPIAPLISCLPLDYAKLAQELNAYSIHINAEIVGKPFIDDAHQRGIKVFVYVVNNEDEKNYLRKLGVDGIFTDCP